MEEFDEVHIQPVLQTVQNESTADTVQYAQYGATGDRTESRINGIGEQYSGSNTVDCSRFDETYSTINEAAYKGFSSIVRGMKKLLNGAMSKVNYRNVNRVFEKGKYVISGDFKFLMAEKQLMLVKYMGIANEVIIPDVVGELPVTFIRSGAFSKGTFATSTRIKNALGVFKQGGIQLKTLDSVKEAFNGIESLQLPVYLKYLPKGLFYHCPKLRSIEIPPGIESIDQNAFRDCGIRRIYFSNAPVKDMKYLKLSRDVSVFVYSGYYSQYKDLMEEAVK
ncbi:MAG: leucine-rich repeat domain-containing protein [Clostridium sp.]|nr:leucine-rich repeat domain-containing protein [Clostridium sp.]